MREPVFSQRARLQHFMHEAESWGRLLSFCKEELMHFKTRLSGLMAESEDEEAVLVAEKCSEEFLHQEKTFHHLWDELTKQIKRVQKELYVDGEFFKEVARCQVKLRREIKKAEALFMEIKNRFSHYLNERYSAEAS